MVPIDVNFVEKLKAQAGDHVYIESDPSRLEFTNSCWEI